MLGIHAYVLQQLQELLRYGHGVELVARDTFCCNAGLTVYPIVCN